MLCYPIRGIRSAVLRAPLSPTRPASGGPRWERGRYREPHWRTRTARKAAVESMSPCAEPALSPVGDSLDDIRPGSSPSIRRSVPLTRDDCVGRLGVGVSVHSAIMRLDSAEFQPNSPRFHPPNSGDIALSTGTF
jgi:hypothetical protein